MKKVLAIARSEYLQAIRSKAFIIGLLAMPLLMGGSILFQLMVKDQVDLTDRHCAVVDPTGELLAVLQAAAQERNAEEIWEVDEDSAAQATADDAVAREQRRPRFLIEGFVPGSGDRADVLLSERVEADELQGFVLLDPDVMQPRAMERPLAYHTDEPTFTELPNWIEEVVNEEVRRKRFEEAGLDRELVSTLSRRVPLSTWGLVSQRDDGSVEEAEEENDIRTFAIPFAGLMLLFMLIMTTAPQLMNQVLEEKMQRISEVLVSSVSPFQLMLGKLLGSVAVSLTLAALYVGSILWAVHYWEVSHFVPTEAYFWFLAMLVFALLMYGSLFSALGSACSELRDAQSLMMPVMVMLMVPLFAWNAVLESPNGTLATALTYFPTATPMLLLVRVLAPPGPPAWEYLAAPLMCVATTIALVWASGKIFRIGVLAQGQTPSFRNLIGWVFSK